MQHTAKYELNIIEMSDPFGPEALNKNAEARAAELAWLHAADAAERTARETAAAAETARVNAALGAKAEQAALAALTQTVSANKSAADTALAAAVKFGCGTYVGDNTVGRKIGLPFEAKAVYVTSQDGITHITGSFSYFYGGLALPGHPVQISNQIFVEIAAGGFLVSHINQYTTSNSSAITYRWFAIG